MEPEEQRKIAEEINALHNKMQDKVLLLAAKVAHISGWTAGVTTELYAGIHGEGVHVEILVAALKMLSEVHMSLSANLEKQLKSISSFSNFPETGAFIAAIPESEEKQIAALQRLMDEPPSSPTEEQKN